MLYRFIVAVNPAPSQAKCFTTTRSGMHADKHADGTNNETNKHTRCGIRAGLLARNDQTHRWIEPKQMALKPIQKQKPNYTLAE
jgi:hypothetical protein